MTNALPEPRRRNSKTARPPAPSPDSPAGSPLVYRCVRSRRARFVSALRSYSFVVFGDACPVDPLRVLRASPPFARSDHPPVRRRHRRGRPRRPKDLARRPHVGLSSSPPAGRLGRSPSFRPRPSARHSTYANSLTTDRAKCLRAVNGESDGPVSRQAGEPAPHRHTRNDALVLCYSPKSRRRFV